MAPLYPCPSCGFLVFDSVPGSEDSCPICDWIDDEFQLQFPLRAVGRNPTSLYEYQKHALINIPVHIKEACGCERDKTWRPLTEVDCRNAEAAAGTMEGYTESSASRIPQYYWKKH